MARQASRPHCPPAQRAQHPPARPPPPQHHTEVRHHAPAPRRACPAASRAPAPSSQPLLRRPARGGRTTAGGGEQSKWAGEQAGSECERAVSARERGMGRPARARLPLAARCAAMQHTGDAFHRLSCRARPEILDAHSRRHCEATPSCDARWHTRPALPPSQRPPSTAQQCGHASGAQHPHPSCPQLPAAPPRITLGG